MGIGWRVQGSGFGLKGSTGSEGSTGVVRRVRKKAPRSLKIGDVRGPYTKSPFPSGRGRPKGGGIGRQLRKQLLRTYAADYEM